MPFCTSCHLSFFPQLVNGTERKMLEYIYIPLPLNLNSFSCARTHTHTYPSAYNQLQLNLEVRVVSLENSMVISSLNVAKLNDSLYLNYICSKTCAN